MCKMCQRTRGSIYASIERYKLYRFPNREYKAKRYGTEPLSYIIRYKEVNMLAKK